MTNEDHRTITEESFTRQAPVFKGPSSVFALGGSSEWAGDFDGSEIVLDVATGAAHTAESVAPLVRVVVGLDVTHALLDIGRDRLVETGVANVLLQRGDAHDLPFVDGSFDVVLCRASLHHLTDPRVALTEMVRVCRAGGRVVISDMVAPSADVRPTIDEVHRLLDPSHQSCFTAEELTRLLSGYGELVHSEAQEPHGLPLGLFVTDAEVLARVEGMMRAELDGAAPTGLEPIERDGVLHATFRNEVRHVQVG